MWREKKSSNISRKFCRHNFYVRGDTFRDRLIIEGNCTGYSIRYITQPQQSTAETKEPRGSEPRLRLRLIILSPTRRSLTRERRREIFPLQRLSGEGVESETNVWGNDLTRRRDNITTTTRCEGRAHVTRRLAGATKYCSRAIRDVRETSDV